MKSKIIIHVKDMSLDEAIWYVTEVMGKGRISDNGEAYCYHVRFGDGVAVSAVKPRRGTNTYTFYVYREGES